MPFLKSPVKIGNYNQKAGSNDNDTLYANGLEIIYGGTGNDTLQINGKSTYSSILVGGDGSDTYKVRAGQFGIIADLRGNNGYDQLFFPASIKSVALLTIDNRHLIGIDQVSGAIGIIIDMFTPHFGEIEEIHLSDQSFSSRSIYDLWKSSGIPNYEWQDVDGVLFDASLAGLNPRQIDNYIQASHQNLSSVVNFVEQEATPKEEETPEGETEKTYITPTLKNLTFNDYGTTISDQYLDIRHLGDNQRQNLAGSEKNDFIELKGGDDIFSGGIGKDRIYGNKGNDQLYGNNDNDYIFGNMGKDLIFGGNGDDKLYGNLQNDDLHGGAGVDSLYGGKGHDTLRGGEGDDVLTGNFDDDIIYGNAGKDKIYGGNGNDKLYGNRGDDIIYGGLGDDFIEGKLDNDSLYGGRGQDSINGGDGDDFIIGGAEADTIIGGSGWDSLDGWDGNDVIFAGEGQNTLTGGKGDDWLISQLGRDNLIGKTGADKFVISSKQRRGIPNHQHTNPKESVVASTVGATNIEDFNFREGDTLLIEGQYRLLRHTLGSATIDVFQEDWQDVTFRINISWFEQAAPVGNTTWIQSFEHISDLSFT